MKVDTAFAEKSRVLLWTSAMHDVARLIAQLARFYEQCAMYHGRDCDDAGEIHVDVRWLAELMNDASSLTAHLASNNFGGACLEVEDLKKGFMSLIEGQPRFDAELWGSRHSWENPRCAVESMTRRWDGVVQSHIAQTTQALEALHGKLYSLDQIYS